MKLIKVAKALNSHGISLGDISFKDELFGIDMNTQAKSGMTLYENGHVKCRYSEGFIDMEDSVENIVYKLCCIFIDCIGGRDYFSKEWADLCVNLGLITKQTSTVTNYNF